MCHLNDRGCFRYLTIYSLWGFLSYSTFSLKTRYSCACGNIVALVTILVAVYMIQDLVLQSLSTLEVKDSDLEATLAALEAAVQELGCLSDVQPERAAAETAREELQQRVAAQQALEDTMASVRRISTSDGAAISL